MVSATAQGCARIGLPGACPILLSYLAFSSPNLLISSQRPSQGGRHLLTDLDRPPPSRWVGRAAEAGIGNSMDNSGPLTLSARHPRGPAAGQPLPAHVCGKNQAPKKPVNEIIHIGASLKNTLLLLYRANLMFWC